MSASMAEGEREACDRFALQGQLGGFRVLTNLRASLYNSYFSAGNGQRTMLYVAAQVLVLSLIIIIVRAQRDWGALERKT